MAEIAPAPDVAAAVTEAIVARMRRANRAIAMTDRLDSLGLESLDVLEIAFDLEQRFDIEVPFNANTALEFDTVGALIAAIERFVKEKAGAK